MELMVGILVILILVLLVLATRLWERVDSQQELLRALSERVWKLETERRPLPVAEAAPSSRAAEPVREAERIPQAPRVATPPPVPPAVAPVPRAPQPPAPSLAEQLRKAMGDQEWEALVGGSILNKIGALVLVIGIALFLGYSLAHMGPAGRAATALAVSVTLLGAGVWVERKEKYRIFSRGLIGAGWAALYATAYAIYAIPEARVIESPFAGSLLLLLVASGMIGHSLRYHAQGVTAVAFFSAFAALAVGPSTLFSVLALIPLAGALLYLAQRFDWYSMALMGLLATYGTCASRGSSDAPLLEVESLFLVYWALFELFDLMRFARQVRGWAVELIFPLNAAGFMALSYAAWIQKAPDGVWELSMCAAAMYLASTLCRVKLELDRGADSETDLADRLRAGCYEAPLAMASFLTAAAIVEKLTGMWMSTALAIEAEMLFTAGTRFRSPFLRGLATLGFTGSLFRLLVIDAPGAQRVEVFGHAMHGWIPVLLLHALLFYGNRVMLRAESAFGLVYSWGGSLLVAVAIGVEFPEHLAGTGWIGMAAVLMEIGIRTKFIEFRQQAYGIGLAGAVATTFLHGQGTAYPWVALAISLAVVYGGAWRAEWMERDDAASREWQLAGWFTCGATALFAGLLVWRLADEVWVGAALWGLAAVLLEFGIRRWPARLRLFSYPVALIAAFAVIVGSAGQFQKFPAQAVWVSYWIAVVAAGAMSARVLSVKPESLDPEERRFLPGALSALAICFSMPALWCVVADAMVPAAWGLFGLVVLEAGNRFDIRVYRWEAQLLAGLAALSAYGYALPDGHPHRLIGIALLIAVHVVFRLRSTAAEGREAKIPPLHLCAAAILAATLIFQEVSGSVLTVAWGAEALILLGAGFVFRERPLRLQGLALFLVCILKLFVYDLRNLETPYRILSFVALGLILLGVSWVYTRFREHLQKLF